MADREADKSRIYGPVLGRLRYWRTRRALSQADLAQESGVSKLTITKAEGGNPVHGRTARKLAAALKVDLDELIGEDPEGE